MSKFLKQLTIPKLCIGFDISQTGQNKTGCGYFSHAMIQSLINIAPTHNFTLYPSFGDFYHDANFSLVNIYPQTTLGAYQPTKASSAKFWSQDNLENALNNPHIIHSNNFWCPTQQLKETKLIYTLYDLGFVENPNWTTEANRLGCFQGVFKASIHADWIVAISEASKNHFLKVFPYYNAERIRVIYPPTKFIKSTEVAKKPKMLKHVKSKSFWLYVSTIEPRKNHVLLLEAYALYLSLGGEPFPLILAGGPGWLMQDFKQLISSLNLNEFVVVTGYISEPELLWLYNNCYANLYPSFFEGFGLPVLEGMQCAAPTICSKTTSLIEIAEGAAILISPYDKQGWAEAMLNFNHSPELRQTLGERAYLQSKKFHWEESARALLSLYQEAWSLPKKSPRGIS